MTAGTVGTVAGPGVDTIGKGEREEGRGETGSLERDRCQEAGAVAERQVMIVRPVYDLMVS